MSMLIVSLLTITTKAGTTDWTNMLLMSAIDAVCQERKMKTEVCTAET